MNNSLYTENLVFHTPEVSAASSSDLDINFAKTKTRLATSQTEITAPQTATASPEVNLLTANEIDLLSPRETQLFPQDTNTPEITNPTVAAPVETNSQATTETVFSADRPIVLPQIKAETENQATSERIAAVRAAIKRQQLEKQNRELSSLSAEQNDYFRRLTNLNHPNSIDPRMSLDAARALADEKYKMYLDGYTTFNGKSIARAETPATGYHNKTRANRPLNALLRKALKYEADREKRQQALERGTRRGGFDSSSLYTRMETGLDRNASNAQRAA